jgi:hypothetical protein
VLINSSADIIGQADVKFAFAVLNDVDAINHRDRKKLVAGAGFEPAIPRPRDYEPDRGSPIIL